MAHYKCILSFAGFTSGNIYETYGKLNDYVTNLTDDNGNVKSIGNRRLNRFFVSADKISFQHPEKQESILKDLKPDFLKWFFKSWQRFVPFAFSFGVGAPVTYFYIKMPLYVPIAIAFAIVAGANAKLISELIKDYKNPKTW